MARVLRTAPPQRTAPAQRRCGSVSVWLDETATYGFVARPDHVRIMRHYRDRGTVRSTTWAGPEPHPDAIWSRARLHLAGCPLPGSDSHPRR